jgi:hypothetical protein
MSTRNDILNELRELGSPLADMSRAMPYFTPSGYFNGLADYTNESVKAANGNIATPGWSKAMPYAIPNSYFEYLPEEILFAVTEQEHGLHLPKSNPLSVPEGYFVGLPQQLIDTIKAEETATKPATRVIPLGDNIWKNVRWAAAAILVLGIGLGSYSLFNGNSKEITPQQELSAVSESTISDYIQQNIDDFDMESIENTVAANTTAAQLDASILTDEEIKLYLDETGWDTEIN